ncbi:YopX family protein [Heyndrickxia sp. FSL W8-0496]|uniref:YopX family protein n=1 Tax=Heyndrickxia sp. FSL W8-0496 TaxID=2954702 RepID=UPI0030FC6C06
MRQPKFRGYSLETNTWHYGHGWFEVDYTEEYKKEKGIEDKARLYTEGYPVECELKSMGEYTGLKDKNGKEIYEGDILKARKSISDETEVYFRVKYTGAAFALVHPEYHNTIYMEVMPWYVRETAEVIGNIYENPSLLEESE